MRITIPCFLTVIVFSILGTLSSGTARAGDHAWQPFTSDVGRFSILMPGTPAHNKHTSSSPVGDIHGTIYTVENDVFITVLEYSDLPNIAAMFASRNRIYTESIKAFLDDVKGHRIADRKIKLDAYIGREISYETAKQTGKARFILIGRRLYVLQVGVDKERIGALSMDHYLDSFQPIYRDNRRG